MKIFIFIISFSLFISCFQQSAVTSQIQTSVQNNSTNQIEKPKEEKPLEKLSAPKQKIKLPNVKYFGITDLRRISENKDKGGLLFPPYDYAEIRNADFVKAKVGEKYTIISLDVNINPFQLPIVKVTKTENGGCDETEPNFLWVIEFERITNREILEISPVNNSTPEFPFDVFLIYPAVEFAKNISHSKLTAEMLPKNLTIKTIRAAIDLDNDKRPDLLEILFCCRDESSSPKENGDCLMCLKLFKRINGKWKLVDEASPC